MAWAPGPQQITSITVGGGNAISGDLITNYSSETEGQPFDSAAGIPVDRGYVTNTISFDCLDYSEVAAIQTLMTNRSLNTVNVTFADGVDKVITSEAVAQITPLVNLVPDTCNFYVEDKDGSQDWVDITGTFTNGGVVMGEPSFEFDFPFDGVDGCGRPYFGGLCRMSVTFQLAGVRGASTDIYASLVALNGGAGFGANVDAAFAMPNGKFLALKNMYIYFYYGPEDASGVRTVQVELRGTATTWAGMLFYTNGATPTALVDAWGTLTNSLHPGDTFAGGNVVLTGTDYTEGGLIVW